MASSLSDLQRAALDFIIEFKKENPEFITDYHKGQHYLDTACVIDDAVCGCQPTDGISAAIAMTNEITGGARLDATAITATYATDAIGTGIHVVNVTAVAEQAVGGSAGPGDEPAKKLTSPERGKTISLEDLIRIRQGLR